MKYQEPMNSHTSMTCSIEFIGYPMTSKIAAECYSQDINKQKFHAAFSIFLIGYRDIQVQINFGIAKSYPDLMLK